MTRPVSRHASFNVTPGAAEKLMELKAKYGKTLRFRVFDDEGLSLRVHDKEYAGDWTFNVADIGIALCRDTLAAHHSLVLDSYGTDDNGSGFGLMLFADGELVNQLDGDRIIARILSEEAEVCDAYGEYCYTAYVTPTPA